LSLKRAEFDRIERKLGLEGRNAKDRVLWFFYEGKRVVFTRRSHGSGDLPASHQIRQQLSVDEKQMRGLIDCSFSRDDYIDNLRAKGKLS
jgi:hypothetical protein